MPRMHSYFQIRNQKELVPESRTRVNSEVEFPLNVILNYVATVSFVIKRDVYIPKGEFPQSRVPRGPSNQKGLRSYSDLYSLIIASAKFKPN